MANRIWMQYGTISNVSSESPRKLILTAKAAPEDIEDDLLFLIERSQTCSFLSWHVAGSSVQSKQGYEISAKRSAFVEQPLDGDDFDAFQKRMENFDSDIKNITKDPYAPILLKLSGLAKFATYLLTWQQFSLQ